MTRAVFYQSILEVIGNTPLVRLNLFSPASFHALGKLEFLNPAGSMKDRPALRMLECAMADGLLKPGGTVVESSSGNMGVGLAQACIKLKLKFICVVDPAATKANLSILKTYGAKISFVSEQVGGSFLQARLNRVQELLKSVPDAFWPDQYANLENAASHHRTIDEICNALGAAPNYLFCPTSTCGLLRGCADYVRERGLETRIIAVDAMGSVIFGSPNARRLLPGHGSARRPELFRPDLAYKVIHVSDSDCVISCRRLVQEEAILAGGSSGAVIAAMEKSRTFIEDDATCVAVLCDRGERYLDTIYSDEWVATNLLDVTFSA